MDTHLTALSKHRPRMATGCEASLEQLPGPLGATLFVLCQQKMTVLAIAEKFGISLEKLLGGNQP